MQDHLDIGSTPPDEDCAQVGSDDYHRLARRECHAYIVLLRRTLGDEPPGARLAVRSNPHDFGSYLSVVCYFDESQPASVDYAYRCESDGPQAWDDQARVELLHIERNPS
jgi:hypothetical protein